MKKCCLVTLLAISLSILLVGCGDNTIGEISSPIIEDKPIETVFAESFEVDNIKKYDFELLFESTQDFNVYSIIDRTQELEDTKYTYNNITYSKQSTGQYDPFDMFIYKNGQFYSLWDLVSHNKLNFKEVEHLVKDYDISIGTESEYTDKYFAENLIEELQQRELLGYPKYNNAEDFITVAYFNLTDSDYDWAILNVDDINLYFDCVFIAKYDTEEQKENILKGIEYRKNQISETIMLPDFIKEQIFSRQKTYDMTSRKVIIFYSLLHEIEGAKEFIDNYVEDWLVQLG